MKRFILALSAFCALMITFASCSSTKVESDSYETEEVTAISLTAKNTAQGGDHYSNEKMTGKNRSFGERMLNLNKFQKYDAFSVYLKPLVGDIFLRKGSLIHREGTDVAGFVMYYDSSSYAVQFAQAERNALISAVKQYKDDFENKKLDRKKKKTAEIYGFVTGYEDFGVVEASMTNFCKPRVYFGYEFVKNNPYFCIFVKKATNLAVNQTQEGVVKESVDQKYYLTKAQATTLSEFLDDSNISKFQKETSVDPVVEEKDSYN